MCCKSRSEKNSCCCKKERESVCRGRKRDTPESRLDSLEKIVDELKASVWEMSK